MATTAKPIRKNFKKLLRRHCKKTKAPRKYFYEPNLGKHRYYDFFILVGRRPVWIKKIMHWGLWMQYARNRILKQTHLPDGVKVSTVFLGLNHNFGNRSPVLFETMIFGGDHDGDQWRYYDYEDAIKGHQNAIEKSFKVEI